MYTLSGPASPHIHTDSSPKHGPDPRLKCQFLTYPLLLTACYFVPTYWVLPGSRLSAEFLIFTFEFWAGPSDFRKNTGHLVYGELGNQEGSTLTNYTWRSGNSCCQLVPELYCSCCIHISKIMQLLQPPLPPFSSVSHLSDTHMHLMGIL